MTADSGERTSYLLALIVTLFVLLAQVGLSGIFGALLLGLILVLAWRLGVIIRDRCNI